MLGAGMENRRRCCSRRPGSAPPADLPTCRPAACCPPRCVQVKNAGRTYRLERFLLYSGRAAGNYIGLAINSMKFVPQSGVCPTSTPAAPPYPPSPPPLQTYMTSYKGSAPDTAHSPWCKLAFYNVAVGSTGVTSLLSSAGTISLSAPMDVVAWHTAAAAIRNSGALPTSGAPLNWTLPSGIIGIAAVPLTSSGNMKGAMKVGGHTAAGSAAGTHAATAVTVCAPAADELRPALRPSNPRCAGPCGDGGACSRASL
jgi:hypothetical protein